MKKICIIAALIIVSTALSAVYIDLTAHLANNESNGQFIVTQSEFDGTTLRTDFINYTSGQSDIVLTNELNGFWCHPDADRIDVAANPYSQPSDSETILTDLSNTTGYDVYLVFENHDRLTSVDMVTGAYLTVNSKSSFRISGSIFIEDPGRYDPEEFGLRFNISSPGNFVRILDTYPAESFDEWYDYTIEFSAEYDDGDEMFLYAGENGIAMIPIYPGSEDAVSYSIMSLEFEYVPDFGDYPNHNISVDSYNTSGEEWHPKISWSQPNNFPSSWLNYFQVEVWRQVNPIMQSAGTWTLISTETMATTSYIDENYNSPGGSGTFGIEGAVRYKVKLTQTTNNPNYSICSNTPGNGEWADSFGFSEIEASNYGTSSGNPSSSRDGFTLDYNIRNIKLTNKCISFSINDCNMSKVEMKLYNLKGQHIHTFRSDDLSYGDYNMNWKGTNKTCKKVSTGMYFLQVKRGDLSIVQKALLIK